MIIKGAATMFLLPTCMSVYLMNRTFPVLCFFEIWYDSDQYDSAKGPHNKER